jgi:hypothetical protein
VISSYEAALVQGLALHPTPPASAQYAAHCQSPAHMCLQFNVYAALTKSVTNKSSVIVLYLECTRFKTQSVSQSVIIIVGFQSVSQSVMIIVGFMVSISPFRQML